MTVKSKQKGSIKVETLQPLKQKETSLVRIRVPKSSCKAGEKQETKTRVVTLKTLWSTKSLPFRVFSCFFLNKSQRIFLRFWGKMDGEREGKIKTLPLPMCVCV